MIRFFILTLSESEPSTSIGTAGSGDGHTMQAAAFEIVPPQQLEYYISVSPGATGSGGGHTGQAVACRKGASSRSTAHLRRLSAPAAAAARRSASIAAAASAARRRVSCSRTATSLAPNRRLQMCQTKLLGVKVDECRWCQGWRVSMMVTTGGPLSRCSCCLPPRQPFAGTGACIGDDSRVSSATSPAALLPLYCSLVDLRTDPETGKPWMRSL